MQMGVIIILMLYGTFTMAKADVPKPRNIMLDMVLNKESLWPLWASTSGITTCDWFSVEASTAEDWTSLWDMSSFSVVQKYKNLQNYIIYWKYLPLWAELSRFPLSCKLFLFDIVKISWFFFSFILFNI